MNPELLEKGMQIPAKFLLTESIVYAKDGDLPQGWYFYDTPGIETGYIVKGGTIATMGNTPIITLKGKGKIHPWKVVSELTETTWGHKDNFEYHLMKMEDIPSIPLNWTSAYSESPYVLIGEF